MTLNEYFKSYYAVICTGNLEDLALYYSEGSDQYLASKQQYETLRQQLDFDLSLKGIELLARQDDLLIIRDQLCFSARVDGKEVVKPSTNLHSLVRESGEWKIFHSTQLPESMVM